MQKLAMGIVLSLAFGTACQSTPTARVDAALRTLGSCADVEASVRETALRDMNQRLDEALRNALTRTSNYCWGEGDAYGAAGTSPPSSAPTPGATNTSSGGSGRASTTSTTNNQVSGVDEADFVKNDDRYIYVVTGSSFQIVDAWPPESAHEIARVAIEGEAKRLFVAGDRAVVYSSLTGSSSVDGRYRSSECTYGYDCQMTGDGKPTKLSVFDLRDRAAPRLVRELRLSGSYIGARRIGDAIHTVVTSPGVSFPRLSYWPSQLGYCQGSDFFTTLLAFESLRRENTRIIESTPMTDWLPAVVDRVVDRDAAPTANLLTSCEGFYGSRIGDGSSFITVLSFDLSRDAAPGFSTIVSRPGVIYASAESLYLAVPHDRAAGREWFGGMENESSATDVHAFRFAQNPTRADYAASGAVKGRVLNQFSLDEWNGHLRLATSVGRVPDPNVYSALHVLRRESDLLYTVGMVDHIAPHEDIRSVRFAGEKGYVVTFKKTDPLYVFDLRDPEAPAIFGELKIPGFSTYMHMLDDTHLLTIGYDAEDHDTFAFFQGILLQIFDVSDPRNPALAHKAVIGTRGSSSEALTDHLAFTYYEPLHLLALPMTICESSGGGSSYGTNMTFSGLMVYDATAENGFAERGRVAHPRTANASCSNWWTNASSEVKRSVFMDDYVFSISDSRIKANRVTSLSVDLADITLLP